MTEHDDALLAAGYALGTLTPEEQVTYDEYLCASMDAQAEAEEFQLTAAVLSRVVTPVAPPAALKAAIMAQLASTPQLPPVADKPTEPARSSAPAHRIASAHRVAGPAATRARARWFSRPAGILVAAAAAVLLFIGGTVVGNGINGGQSFQQQQASALARINSAPDAQRATATVAGGGTATVVWSSQVGKSALLVNGLGTLPSDKVYELWYIKDGSPVPAGTMTANTNGTTTWRILEGNLIAGAAVGVTVEPHGGSKKPTTTPLVAIQT